MRRTSSAPAGKATALRLIALLTPPALLLAPVTRADAAPPPAQEEAKAPTADGALRFVASVVPDTAAAFVYDWGEGRGRLHGVSASKPCEWTIDLTLFDNSSGAESKPLHFPLMFAKVRDVSAEGGQVVIVSGLSLRDTWTVGSAALATRVARALDFMRQRCDATADTGF